MSGFFSKLLGLFVERVPVDEQGRQVKPVPPPRGAARPATPSAPAQPGSHQGPTPAAPIAVPVPNPTGAPQRTPQPHPGAGPGMPGGAGADPALQFSSPAATPAPHGVAPSPAAPTVAVAMRAVVPQEYAAHLAPYGLHVLAAGGDVTSEQARGWGAQVLVISADCLGRDLHLLQSPQMPTVFIAPQPVMIPEQPGVVQIHEPLHASDVARAVREAAQAWAAAGRSASH